jgi:hypothetical protein
MVLVGAALVTGVLLSSVVVPGERAPLTESDADPDPDADPDSDADAEG